MLRDPIAIRRYNFTDAELKQVGDRILQIINRDIIEFTDYGFTPAKKAEYETALSVFANIDTDDFLASRKMVATTAKNNKRAVLETILRRVTTMAKLCFKGDLAKLKAFGELALAHQTDDSLVRTARTAESSSIFYAAELLTEGITAQHIQTLKAAREAFDEAIDLQNEAISNRDIATALRIAKGNELYELIGKYSEIGKLIWIETSEPKHNDYLLYNSPKTDSKANDSGTTSTNTTTNNTINTDAVPPPIPPVV